MQLGNEIGEVLTLLLEAEAFKASYGRYGKDSRPSADEFRSMIDEWSTRLEALKQRAAGLPSFGEKTLLGLRVQRVLPAVESYEMAIVGLMVYKVFVDMYFDGTGDAPEETRNSAGEALEDAGSYANEVFDDLSALVQDHGLDHIRWRCRAEQ